MKKCIISLFFLTFFVAADLYAYEATVNNFTELQTAIAKSTDATNTININTSQINFASDINTGNKKISFNLMQSSSVFNLQSRHISANRSNLEFNDIAFINGNAQNGGVFEVSNTSITFSGETSFSSNTASRNGGAIYISTNSNITFKEKTTFSGNRSNGSGGAVYYSNNAFINFNGPTIFTNNEAFGSGGAVNAIQGSSVTFKEKTTFNGNLTTMSGGAVYNAVNSNITFYNDVLFSSNTAGFYGGALYTLNNTIINFSSSANLINNTARSGGALYTIQNTSTTFNGETIFSNNSATTGFGGAIVNNDNSIMTFNNNVSFSSNSSVNDSGGAIYVVKDSILTFNNTASFNNNSAGKSGGAIFALNKSSITFNGEATFSNNSANVDGGALYSDNSIMTFNNDVLFSSNSSPNQRGGTLYAINGSSITFNGKATFDSNVAKDYGGAVNGNRSIITFNNDAVFNSNYTRASGGAMSAHDSNVFFAGKAIFSGNSVNSLGGAILTNGSAITFNTDALFNGNSANSSGGAIYGVFDSITIFNTDVLFSSNTAKNFGGAVYINKSNLTADGKSTFNNNSAGSDGGAVYNTNNSVATFNTDVLFSSNASIAGSGGAVFATGGSSVTFSGKTSFSSNTAGSNGGAVFISTNSKIVFGKDAVFSGNQANSHGGAVVNNSMAEMAFNGMASFSGNTAQDSGGAVFAANGSALTFNSEATFNGNTAGSNGGAVFADNNAVINFSSSAIFTANTAEQGGAVNITDGSKVTFTNAGFINNMAQNSGGAIFVDAASSAKPTELTFNTSSATVFSGNTANGASNAMHIGKYSSILFNMFSGGIVNMNDKMTSALDATDSSITITGNGEFNLNADATTGNIDYSLSGNSKFNISNSVNNIYVKTLEMKDNAALNMNNAKADILNAENFIMSNGNTLEMDIISSTPENDTITAQDDVKLDGTLNVYVGVGDYTNKEMALIISQNGQIDINSEFNDVNLIALTGATITPEFSKWHIEYTPDWFKLFTKFSISTDFLSYPGLSHNQTEVAKVIDPISGTLAPGDELALILDDILMTSVAHQLDALTLIAGGFIGNVMMSPLLNNNREKLLGRILPREFEDGSLSSVLWAQAGGSYNKLKKDENTEADFKSGTAGVRIGADIMNREKTVLGVYGGYNHNELKQGKSSGNIDEYEAGVYGGYIGERWDFKATIEGGYQKYETTRKLKFGHSTNMTAKGEFSGYSAEAGLEAAYKIPLTERTTIKPFAGADAGWIRTESFKEKGAGALNLNVKEESQIMADVLGGLMIEWKKNDWFLRGGAYAKYLLTENKGIFKGSLESVGKEMEIWGSEIGRLSGNITAGAGYRFSDRWSIYANAGAGMAKDYVNYQGNIGINFCISASGAKDRTKEEEERKYIEQYEETERILAEEERQRKIEEARLQKEAEDEEAARINAERQKQIKAEEDARLQKEAEERRQREMIKTFRLVATTFETNKYNLTEKTKKAVNEIAEELKSVNYKKVTIEGHTDSTGSAETNENLSKLRAKAVYTELAANGIPEEKMEYIGFASKMPIESNKTASGRAANRRVEIFVE